MTEGEETRHHQEGVNGQKAPWQDMLEEIIGQN